VRSNMRTKSLVGKSLRAASHDAFFDRDTIEKMNAEDENLMPPQEAFTFEVPASFDNDEPRLALAQADHNATISEAEVDVEGFGWIGKQNLRFDSMETDNRNMRPAKPNLEPVKLDYNRDYTVNMSHFRSPGSYMDSDGESDSETSKSVLYKFNVTGKVEITIPESSFAGETYPEGQAYIKKMMKHAWEGYKASAWGQDDLRPWSKRGKNCLGGEPLGLTITDSLDTLHLMGMKEEYTEGAEWVFSSLDFDKTKNLVVSMFETNIRLLGGFLSNYALTKDERFLEKAKDLGDRFMKNFSADRKFPRNDLRLSGKAESRNSTQRNPFANSGTVSLAQIGTFSVEFGYLSHLTGNPIYKEKAVEIIKTISELETSLPGLYPSIIQIDSKNQGFQSTTVSRSTHTTYKSSVLAIG